MERVTQKYKTDCGVACIAMVCGISYAESLKLVHPKRKPRQRFYTSAITISEILKSKNYKFKVYLCKGLKNIKNTCILGVRHPTDNKSTLPKKFHWVVLNNGNVLDPWIDNSYDIKYCKKKTFIIYEIQTP